MPGLTSYSQNVTVRRELSRASARFLSSPWPDVPCDLRIGCISPVGSGFNSAHSANSGLKPPVVDLTPPQEAKIPFQNTIFKTEKSPVFGMTGGAF